MESMRGVIRGCSQEYKGVVEFQKDSVYCGKVYLGPGPSLYRRWDGVAQVLVPVPATPEELSVYVEKVDWSLVPSKAELNYLFQTFFRQYDREILVVVGSNRDTKERVYFVPKQTGTKSGVEWEADTDIEEFHRIARWVGTIHTHPNGMSPTASGVDVKEWGDKEKSGLHIILGHDKTYNVYLVVEGRTIPLKSDRLSGVSSPVVLWRSCGKPLEELLLEPKPWACPPEMRIPYHMREKGCGEDAWMAVWGQELELDQGDFIEATEQYGLLSGDILDRIGVKVDEGMACWCSEGEQLIFLEIEELGCVMPLEEYEDLLKDMGLSQLNAYHVGTSGRGRRVYT